MAGLLLDTHALLWLVQGSKELGKKALNALSKSPKASRISAISLLEVAMLLKKGRITVEGDQVAFLRQLELRFPPLPLNATIAHRATELTIPQADPFDRVIVATALEHGLILVTRDKEITRSRLVTVLW